MVLFCDPLHVLWGVGATSTKGAHVVDVKAWAGTALQAGGGARVLGAECAHLGAVARNLGFGRCPRQKGKREAEQGGIHACSVFFRLEVLAGVASGAERLAAPGDGALA